MIMKVVIQMVNYDSLIYNLAQVEAPTVIVFLMLALILDYLRTMLFSSK